MPSDDPIVATQPLDAEDMDANALNEWVRCPNCGSPEAGLRINRTDGEIVAVCPECKYEKMIQPGEPLDAE